MMSTQTIKALIVDEDEETRDKLIEQLRFEDISVVGESTFGAAAFTWAEQLDVDVVIVTIGEPIARSLRTVESLSVGTRSWPVLGISQQGNREMMRKAMVAGVRDYLVLPVSAEELRQAVVNLYRNEQTRRTVLAQGQTGGRVGTIVAVVGVKGGIGKSSVASNIAIALAEQTKQQIAMADLDLQFGDAAVMLDVVPERTIEQAAAELTQQDPQLIHGYMTDHASRVRLLAAPNTPEGGDGIAEEQVGQILQMLAATHDYVVVDTAAQLDPISIRAMDMATLVLLVVIPEVPSVRRTKAALQLMQDWGYTRDKVKLVVNRVRKKNNEVSVAQIEEVLEYPVYAEIPDDPALVKGVSLGAPVVLSAPKSEAGRAFTNLGRALVGMPMIRRRRGLLRRKEPDRSRSSGRQAPLAAPATSGIGALPGSSARSGVSGGREVGPALAQRAAPIGGDGQRASGANSGRSVYPLSRARGGNGTANQPDDGVIALRQNPTQRDGSGG